MNFNQIPWSLLSDIFKVQQTDKLNDLVRESSGKMTLAPRNQTILSPYTLQLTRVAKIFSGNKHNLGTPTV